MTAAANRIAAAIAALTAILLGSGAAAKADPGLSATGVRQEPGLVEFFLSAADLPYGTGIDPDTITVSADGVALPVRRAEQVATTGAGESMPRRLAVLVLDTSGSMKGEPMAAARLAATRYAAALPADVDVAVVTAATKAVTALAPTADRARVITVLQRLTAGGETALYDGLRTAATLVGGASYAERRVLLLSDGADTTSMASREQAQAAAVASGVPFDTVAFRTAESTTGVLAGVSGATGGTAYAAADVAALSAAFRSAAGAFVVQLLVSADVPPELAGREVRLEVAATAGAQTVRTTVPVRLALDPTAATPLSTIAARGLPFVALAVLVVVVFGALLIVGFMAFSPMLDLSRQRRRLAEVERFALTPRVAKRPSDGTVARAALALSEHVVRSGGFESRVTAQLERANLRLRPHEWLLLRALLGFVACVVLSLFIGPQVGIPAGLVLGWAGTAVYRGHRASRRTRAFTAQLPDALQLIIGSLRSGFSLHQAIEAMVRELPDPLSTEFSRALGETRLGVRLEDALDRLAQRMDCPDLSWTVVAVRVQREVGGNLAEVLETTAGTMRDRESLRRHVRALSAEGRLSAWVLLALPLVMAAFMFVFRREYLRPLYSEPIGLTLIVVGVGLVGFGGLWMSRMVKVKV